ncbi:hypothetical protein Q4Q49_02370 [Shewanella sp. SP1S1-7]|uniref:hypothetical protein n=1 Tax=Shewanella sp. SP1S1-7 TaxID=3063536 RepID=UPI00288DFE56|nr:hypothetical protein [Shewanella sp. SP1S1-7]MDT3334128.1 hypothetical protein [Shewanella sp. SP1S1-7]
MKDIFEQIFTPFKSMSEHIKYRLSNPLGIAFVFSWIIFNWQAVYYFMFSNDTASSKITYLQKIYLTDKGYDLSNLLWCPLGASVLYLVVAPLVSNIATGLWSVIDQSCTALRLKFVENATLMTNADKTKMYLALNKMKAEHASEIEKLRNEISGLQSLLTLQTEIITPSETENVKPTLTGKFIDGPEFEGMETVSSELVESDSSNDVNKFVVLPREVKFDILNNLVTPNNRVRMLDKWFDENIKYINRRHSSLSRTYIIKVLTLLIDSSGEISLSVLNELSPESPLLKLKLVKQLQELGYIEEVDKNIRLTAKALDSFMMTITTLDEK